MRQHHARHFLEDRFHGADQTVDRRCPELSPWHTVWHLDWVLGGRLADDADIATRDRGGGDSDLRFGQIDIHKGNGQGDRTVGGLDGHRAGLPVGVAGVEHHPIGDLDRGSVKRDERAAVLRTGEFTLSRVSYLIAVRIQADIARSRDGGVGFTAAGGDLGQNLGAAPDLDILGLEQHVAGVAGG